MLLSMTFCPKCNGGHNTPCYAVYSDGVKCYSCGYASKSWIPRAKEEAEEKKYQLPKYTTNVRLFNPEAVMFFNKYYIDESKLEVYGIGYSEEHHSVLYPLWPNYTQERMLSQKKFITYGKVPVEIVKKTNLECSSRIILTEDFISCMRAADFADTLCLFGTNIKEETLLSLVKKYEQIIIWLDGDEPGRKASIKIEERLKRIRDKQSAAYPMISPVDVFTINTENDPKTYSPSQMKEIIHASITKN